MIINQVDCIVRFHDSTRLYELNRCIFSLYGQTHRPLNIILVTQRFSSEDIAKTLASLNPILNLPHAPTLVIKNWESPTPRDARTELLNMGLAVATGRYVAFLDYDDVLYPEAYALLTNQLRGQDAAIAFASVRVMNADIFPQFMRISGKANVVFVGQDLRNLFQANFCPIHSYLIDRTKISPEHLCFDTSLTWEEDYDLLLKLCSAYQSNFDNINKIIGDYYYKTDGSNSVPTTNSLSAERQQEYARVCVLIEARRKSSIVAPSVLNQLGLSDSNKTISIRDALNLLT